MTNRLLEDVLLKPTVLSLYLSLPLSAQSNQFHLLPKKAEMTRMFAVKDPKDLLI